MAPGRKRQQHNAHATPKPSKRQKPVPPTGDTSATLYVKNLNDKIAIADLRVALYMLFSMCGHVVAINAHKSGKMRGQAHIAFANAASASVALRLSGKQFLGKPIHIEYAKTESTRLQWLQKEAHN